MERETKNPAKQNFSELWNNSECFNTYKCNSEILQVQFQTTSI